MKELTPSDTLKWFHDGTPNLRMIAQISVVVGQRILSNLIGSTEQCNNVGGRHIGLKVVAARKYIAAAPGGGISILINNPIFLKCFRPWQSYYRLFSTG